MDKIKRLELAYMRLIASLYLRKVEGMTLQQVSNLIGGNKERIRQIQAKAERIGKRAMLFPERYRRL